jgi:nitric oxide dioxygenase
MTPEQIALVQQSYAEVQEHLPALARAFYAHLFALDPEIEALFTTAPEIQQAKFIDELNEIVWSVANLDAFVTRASDLGARHLAYGTRARHYGPVGAALLAALADTLGSAFTDETHEAWSLAYNLVAETMQRGAMDAARSMRG